MSAPGWYPDPAQAGQVRYWDGHAWTAQVRPHGPTPSSPTRRGPWVAAVVMVVAVAMLLFWWRPWSTQTPTVQEDTNSSAPSISGWDETSAPTKDPSPDPSGPPVDEGGRPVACPEEQPGVEDIRGNRFHSGGLSFEGVRGWESSGGWALDFATDRSGQRNTVTQSWVAVTAIATLDMEHFPYPEQAAKQISDCMATAFYYRDLERREVLESRAYDVGGRPGWLLRANFWNRTDTTHGVPGDEVVILVVDTGRPDSLAIFHTEVPIGDARRLDLVRRALESVQLD